MHFIFAMNVRNNYSLNRTTFKAVTVPVDSLFLFFLNCTYFSGKRNLQKNFRPLTYLRELKWLIIGRWVVWVVGHERYPTGSSVQVSLYHDGHKP